MGTPSCLLPGCQQSLIIAIDHSLFT